MLRKYQTAAIQFSKNKAGVLWSMGVGTGKTLTALELIKQRGATRVLVVAPKKAGYVWFRDSIKFEFENEIILLNEGSVKSRISYLRSLKEVEPEITQIIVINYDVLPDKVLEKALSSFRWDMIIADEAHRLKAPQGAQSKALFRIAKASPTAFRLGLSGTPFTNRPLDIFGVARFINPDVFGLGYTKFRHRYAVYGGYMNYELQGYINQKEFSERYDSFTYTVNREDALELPGADNVDVVFELEEKTLKIYRDLKNKSIGTVRENAVVVGDNPLTRALRLQQLTSGIAHISETGKEYIDKAREQRFMELLEDIGTEPIVVFYRFAPNAEVIRKASGKCFINGQQNDLDQWKREGGLLGVQIQAGSEGIDLTETRTVIFYSTNSSLKDYTQALGRADRPGQTQRVMNYHLIAANTIDEDIYKAFKEKRNILDAINQGLRNKFT